MGDRVLVTFTDDDSSYTPAVYMHWSGHEAADMIRAAAPLMRRSDPFYAAARFCGFCATQIQGPTGLGLMDAPGGVDWGSYSHGGAGVYVVNVRSGKVSAYGGYGKPFNIDPAMFAT